MVFGKVPNRFGGLDPRTNYLCVRDSDSGWNFANYLVRLQVHYG
jgi:hypothetical protein